MSCYLTHKEAINNFKEDLGKTGYKEIVASENFSIKEIASHNLLVEQEAAKLQPVIDSWDKAVAVMGLPGNVVKSIISHSTSFGVTKKTLDIQINESVFDKIDDKRKELGIYDSKLAYSSYVENKISPKPGLVNNLTPLESKIVEGFLKDFNINITEYTSLKEELGIDAYSASDIITKSIAYQKGNSILPEVAYFAYSMLGKKNNKIRSDLRYLINKWDKFPEKFRQYSKLVEEKEGFIKDKTEWKTKIRDLIIIDYLKEQLSLHYSNPQEFKKVNDKAWTKDDFSVWNKIIKMIEEFLELFSKDNRKKKQHLNNLSLSIVDEILSNNYDYFNYKLKDSQILKEYAPTIKTDSFAEELVNFGQKELNIVLTGSLALRKAGTVYRTEEENLHDIDWVIPFDKLNKQDLLTIQSKQNSFGQESSELILPIIERQEFFKRFKDKYPSYKIINNFYGGEHESMESLTIQGVVNGEFYSSDGKHTETIAYKKKNFFTKEITVIEEERIVNHKKGDWIKDTGYVIDFFVRLTPNQEEHENYFKLWKEIMKAKLMMGRDKDFIDWQAFKPVYSSADKFNFYYAGYKNINYLSEPNSFATEQLSLEDYYISHKSLYEQGTYEEYLQYREKTNNKLEIASKEDVSLFKKYVEEQDIDSQLDFNNKCK